MPIEIVSVIERPDLVPAAAQWMWHEWGRKNGRSLADMATWLATHTASIGPNQAWVLLDAGIPAATASFELHDLDDRPDLSPWLANLVVDPDFRGRGHAIRLVHHTEAACRAAGISPLYLNTEHAARLYARLGWAEIGTAPHKGHPVTIMRRDFAPDRP